MEENIIKQKKLMYEFLYKNKNVLSRREKKLSTFYA